MALAFNLDNLLEKSELRSHTHSIIAAGLCAFTCLRLPFVMHAIWSIFSKELRHRNTARGVSIPSPTLFIRLQLFPSFVKSLNIWCARYAGVTFGVEVFILPYLALLPLHTRYPSFFVFSTTVSSYIHKFSQFSLELERINTSGLCSDSGIEL